MTIPDHMRVVVTEEHRDRIQLAIYGEVKEALAPFVQQPATKDTLLVIRATVNDILTRRAVELDVTHWYVDISAVGDVYSRPSLQVDLQAPRHKGPGKEPAATDVFLGWYHHFDLWRVTLQSGLGVFVALGEGLVEDRAMATVVAGRRWSDLPK